MCKNIAEYDDDDMIFDISTNTSTYDANLRCINEGCVSLLILCVLVSCRTCAKGELPLNGMQPSYTQTLVLPQVKISQPYFWLTSTVPFFNA